MQGWARRWQSLCQPLPVWKSHPCPGGVGAQKTIFCCRECTLTAPGLYIEGQKLGRACSGRATVLLLLQLPRTGLHAFY